MGRGGIDWIELDQDRGNWRALVNAAMNLRFIQNAGNFFTSCKFTPLPKLRSFSV